MSLAFLNGIYMSGGDGVLAALIDRSVVEVEIPYGVTKIGNYAFCGCNKLAKITIPEGVTSIGQDAFKACSALEAIAFPQSLVTIDRQAVMDCHNLKRIVLPHKVSVIPITFASSCWAMTEFIAEGNISVVNGYSFQHCNSCKKYDFTHCTSVPILTQTTAFVNIPVDCKIYVPTPLYDEWVAATNWAEYADHIVGVGEAELPTASEGLAIAYGDAWGMDADQYTLKGRGSCTDSFVVIPEKYDDGIHGELEVKDIAQFAFSQDYTLTAIYIPKTITGIWSDPMAECGNLKRIYMPGVQWVASIHFCDLPSLEYVKFGSGLNDIGGSAFNRCAAGAVYDFTECESVPTLDSYGAGQEFGTDPVIKVPASLYDEWKAATNWTLYADYIVAAE